MKSKMRQIVLTDLMLHTRGFRPTGSFAKAEQKAIAERKETGRVFSPLPEGYEKDVTPDGKFTFKITLPPDLQEMLRKGEAELVVPKDGLTVYAGRDMIDFLGKLKRKQRRQDIHRNPPRVWHADEKGVE